MQRKKLVSLVGSLSVLIGGCDSLPFFGGNNASSPSPTPVAAVTASSKSSPGNAPNSIASPLSPPKAGASPIAAAKAAPQAPVNPAATGLITSLPSDERLRQNAVGRNDPFAIPLIQPLVKEPTGGGSTQGAGAAPTNQRPIPSLPQVPLPPLAAFPILAAPRVATATAATRSNATVATATRGGTATPARTPGAISQPFTPQLPALPEPSLARLVEVSGIIDVAGAPPKAIIKAPNETSSRYVSQGERLSDGLILVKRIEMTGPGGPVVVLEQFGVEVTRRVGDRPATSPNQTGSRPT